MVAGPALAAFLLCCAIPRASASGATKLLVGVHERLSDWRIGEAEALLTLMTAVFPSHTEVRRARARLAYLQGEYDEAVRL
ncbi:MAG: hypothetical protein RBU30_01485, partial [Polyangia bacterium]|nr:hypothetical protein [Polyangia bacterium]